MMSIKDIELRKKFWESQHASGNKASLSGCEFQETMEFLKLIPFIEQDKRVLEVGVGLGYVTLGLFEVGCKVSALDISKKALKPVSTFCEHTYLVDSLEELPIDYFDVILCHNLVQHIPTYLLAKELSFIFVALKPGGVFALEFVSSEGVQDSGKDVVYNGDQVGNYCRSVPYMQDLIQVIGGESELVVNNKCKIGKVTGCHVLHITKK